MKEKLFSVQLPIALRGVGTKSFPGCLSCELKGNLKRSGHNADYTSSFSTAKGVWWRCLSDRGFGAGVFCGVLFVVIRRTVSIPSVSNEGSRSLMLALGFSVLLFCIQNCPLQGRNTAQALDGESRTKKGLWCPRFRVELIFILFCFKWRINLCH